MPISPDSSTLGLKASISKFLQRLLSSPTSRRLKATSVFALAGVVFLLYLPHSTSTNAVPKRNLWTALYAPSVNLNQATANKISESVKDDHPVDELSQVGSFEPYTLTEHERFLMHSKNIYSRLLHPKDLGGLLRIFRKTLDNIEANPDSPLAIDNFTAMREALFPYLGDAIFHKSAYADSGIVICAGSSSRRNIRHALSTILGIRRVLESDLPVEVFHLGEKDPITDEDRRKFLAIPNVRIRDLTDDLIGRNDMGMRTWDIKPLAMLASSFRHVILMDADCNLLQKPDALLTSPKYLKNGALFFHDRTKGKAQLCSHRFR
ncbi:MAG: hypothetical protein SGCHY_005460 [Lobulomycetales sp.]